LEIPISENCMFFLCRNFQDEALKEIPCCDKIRGQRSARAGQWNPTDDDPNLIHSKFRKALSRTASLSTDSRGFSQQLPVPRVAEEGQVIQSLQTSCPAIDPTDYHQASYFPGENTQLEKSHIIPGDQKGVVASLGSTGTKWCQIWRIWKKFSTPKSSGSTRPTRERYLCKAISEREASVFSPRSSTSCSSSTRSYDYLRSSSTSRITISPLHCQTPRGHPLQARWVAKRHRRRRLEVARTDPAHLQTQHHGRPVRLMAGLHHGLAMLPVTSTLGFGLPRRQSRPWPRTRVESVADIRPRPTPTGLSCWAIQTKVMHFQNMCLFFEKNVFWFLIFILFYFFKVSLDQTCQKLHGMSNRINRRLTSVSSRL